MKQVVFSIEKEVVRNTLEYIFIGKNDFTFTIVESIGKGSTWVRNDLSLVICECSFTNQDELNGLVLQISVLRKQLNKNIPLILFSENPESLETILCTIEGKIRIVALDHFFLDNLFEVMQEEIFSESLACCYSM